jgi:calcineurin-like phosphoesterase family protein
MTVFFTSDTHFGHLPIIASCRRPYGSAEEMDEGLIARWNGIVSARDTVYHLGDFCHRGSQNASDYLDRLNGDIHLIVGNHDAQTLQRHAARFASVSLIGEIDIGGRALVLCHYPMREWNGCYQGAWHLFGHVHGRLNHVSQGLCLDVGVDCNAYRPLSFEDVTGIMARRVCPFEKARKRTFKKTIRALSPP